MLVLILGLIIFLGVHSVRIFADDWRRATIARLGDGPWKGIYSLVSMVGFVLIVWGYGMARQDPVLLWLPPMWLRHVAILLNLVAFVLFAAYHRAVRLAQGAARPSDDPFGEGLGLRASPRQRHARRSLALRRVPGLGDRRLRREPPPRPGGGNRPHRRPGTERCASPSSSASRSGRRSCGACMSG